MSVFESRRSQTGSPGCRGGRGAGAPPAAAAAPACTRSRAAATWRSAWGCAARARPRAAAAGRCRWRPARRRTRSPCVDRCMDNSQLRRCEGAGICSRVAPEAVLLALGALAGRERRRDLSRAARVAERVLLLDDAAVVVAHRLAVDVPGALRRGLALREEHRRRRAARLGRRRRERRVGGGLGGLGGSAARACTRRREPPQLRVELLLALAQQEVEARRVGALGKLAVAKLVGVGVDEPSQLCQHADGSQKPTSPETKPLMRHVDSICAISRQAARCVRPSVASLQMACAGAPPCPQTRA